MSFFSYSEPNISTSVALTYTKTIPIYILKVLTEGFVHILFRAGFIWHFIPKNRANIYFFFNGIWQYFLIYGVMKKEIQKSLSKNHETGLLILALSNV